MDLNLLWIIQLSPMIAFLAIQLLPRNAKKIAPVIGIFGALTAAVAALVLLTLHGSHAFEAIQFNHRWLEVTDKAMWQGGISVDGWRLFVGFLLDPLNLWMITLVTTISFFVQVFSAYYMAEDPSRARYFGFLSFFSFSMTGLVLSSNFLQTFLFWELVGLTSYLLIGFWYEKPSAATAARKAFVMNRLGDLGFYLGIIALFLWVGTLQFTDLNHEFLRQSLPQATLTVIALLVFMGVMGKSAQFPFHAWLPDAMEGPTPVSALIHSATMVAAGVFLLARGFGLFGSTSDSLTGILIIGSLTALVGATLATVQRDIKKILAYSTVSQLGFMVMAIGAGSSTAGIFHLSTHAYFKSLLFLTAGAFIHHFHTNDIWEIGRRGGKKDLLAVAALMLGLFSLCGIFPFSGFFSKDMILETLKEQNLFFYSVAVLVSFLTVYYSFRMLFVILFSKPSQGHHDDHPQPALTTLCRALPLIGLGLISLWVGALGTPVTGSWMLHWLGGHEAHLNIEILWTTIGLVVTGAGLAYWQFREPEAALKRLDAGREPLQKLLENKFYVDDAYSFLVKKIGLSLAAAMNWFDKKVISGIMVDETSFSILRLGRVAARIQNGLLQDYLAWALSAGILILFYLIHAMKGL